MVFFKFMIDLCFFRNNKSFILNNLMKRGFVFDYDKFSNLDFIIKTLKTDIYRVQREHNFLSFLLKMFIHESEIFKILLLKNRYLKDFLFYKNNELKKFNDDFLSFLSNIPNLLDNSVPIGFNSSDNVEVRVFVNSKNNIPFFNNKLFKDFEFNIDYIDFDVAAKISGSGFVVLKNVLAELYRAVGNYMVDRHIFLSGYKEIYSPLLVTDRSMFFSGHFPKFKEDQFNVSGTDLWLIPTGEVVLVNLISNFCVSYKSLPLKFVSKTSCFRKEKGSYGYLVKGMIRQHQFDKVELVHIVEPNMSKESLDELVFNAEVILQELDLSYRVLSLCSGDIGFTSEKTYDLEVWLPKRKIYLEVSSCSNTGTFQSRRMNARVNYINHFEYPHILNGSGLAIGRVVLAIIENYSDSFGQISIPDVLVKYMNGKRYINF